MTSTPAAAAQLPTRAPPPTSTRPARPPWSITPQIGRGEAPKPPESLVRPIHQERIYANVGAAAIDVPENIYEEITPLQLTAPPLPPRRSLAPAFQPGNATSAPTATEGTPDPVPQSHEQAQQHRKLALAHLAAAGVKDPEFELVRIYRRHVRDRTHFDEQVQFAAERYQEEMQNYAYLAVAFDIADGISGMFRRFTRLGRTEDQRRDMGGRLYAQYSANIKPFVGPMAKEYLQSFDDQPISIHNRVVRDAAAFSRSAAARERAGAMPVPPDATRV